jgi:hypothetical protein
MIILPRQARDKHRESAQKRCRFSQDGLTARENNCVVLILWLALSHKHVTLPRRGNKSQLQSLQRSGKRSTKITAEKRLRNGYAMLCYAAFCIIFRTGSSTR